MKRIFSLTTIAILAISATAFAGTENDERPPTILIGSVEDLNMPLSGATVRLLNTNFATTTDAHGGFMLRSIPEGTYQMEISHIGYQPIRREIKVSASDDAKPIRITLEIDEYQLPQSTVISQKDHLFRNVPGSVKVTNKQELDRIQAISSNEILRRTPGLNVVDEEGAGLRLNVGVRGLDPDRSRKVLVLEDGIPVALNPYGEPEMYYSPSIDRMEGVEVIKGSGQILYGPQSVGGVINFITADPPLEEELKLKVQGGQGGYGSILAKYGNTYNKTGVQVTYLRKQAEELGPTSFLLNDLNAKVRIPISNKSVVGIKFSAYDEKSNSTYLGMTQRMFEMGENDYQVLAPHDNLDVNRYAVSANHRYNLGKGLMLQSTLFANTTTRNWRRQDYTNNSFNPDGTNNIPSNFTGVMYGDSTVEGGAIFMRNRTGNRNRTFEVAGWEQKVQWTTSELARIQNDLQVGYRFMYERAYEQRINGSTAEALSGVLVGDEIRTGRAFSAYILDKITLSKRFELSPGVRIENYSFEREVMRVGSVDTMITANNTVFSVIPGVGGSLSITKNFNLYGGVHRGYSPPRVKDAIDFSVTNPVLDIDAEKSWNYEFGLRVKPMRGIRSEITLFLLDFENQVIAQSESSGGAIFGVVNAGATLNRGVEAGLEINSRELLRTRWAVLADVQATLLRATFNEDRMVGDVNINGNRLPYAPDLTISSGMTVEAPFGTGLRLTYTHIGEQFTNDVNSIEATADGKFGKMDAFSLIDLTAYHHVHKWKTRFNISVKNITNERYIATRRPSGISLGLPRFITMGAEIQL